MKILSLRVLAVAILTMVAAPAVADTLIAVTMNVTIRLYDKPCTTDVVLAKLEESFHAKYRQGSAAFKEPSHTRELCWLDMRPEYAVIFIADDEGVQAELDPDLFKSDVGI